MADLSQVRDTIKSILAAAIYPSGTSAPSAIAFNSGHVAVALVAGWPVKDQLEKDLALGIATVSVFPIPGQERNTSRFVRDWQVLTGPMKTLTATVSGDQVTIGGTVSTPQNVAVISEGVAYLYGVQPGDTLASIAAALAALISGASSLGAVITIPSAIDLVARTGGVGTLIRELRRQERSFQVTCWCATPEQRDVVAPFVDGVLIGAGLPNGREFIALPDGSQGRILYERSAELDQDQLVGAFRRDLFYCVDFPTTETMPAAEVVTNEVALAEPLDGSVISTLDS